MGFSLLAEGVLRHYLADAPWRSLIAKLGYTVGFLIVIVGKQQLFTENTLTPMIPAMHNRDFETLTKVAKLWAVVLGTNLIGAHLIGWFYSNTSVLKPELQAELLAVAREATEMDPWAAFLRGIVAGWLIAMVVWLRAATDSGELAIIIILTYLIALGSFTHIIAGAVECAYLVFAGQASWRALASGYAAPVLAGNIVGGVLIVAALNHAQVITEEKSK